MRSFAVISLLASLPLTFAEPYALPNAFAVAQGSVCPSGSVACEDTCIDPTDSCCVGGGGCPSGFYCDSVGCCPTGETCDGTIAGCAPGSVSCVFDDNCITESWTCCTDGTFCPPGENCCAGIGTALGGSSPTTTTPIATGGGGGGGGGIFSSAGGGLTTDLAPTTTASTQSTTSTSTSKSTTSKTSSSTTSTKSPAGVGAGSGAESIIRIGLQTFGVLAAGLGAILLVV